MRFSAVILAGGRSQRMGQDKAWLPIEGQPLLARQVALVQAVGATEVLISGRPEVDYSPFGCPVLLDAWPGCGPLGGIERALAAANHKLVLVLAVDLPHLGASLLHTLLSECTEETGVVPVCEESLEPLVALYPKAAHAIALARLQAERYAAREFALECWHNQLIRRVPVPTGLTDFINWNRPEDWRGVEALKR